MKRRILKGMEYNVEKWFGNIRKNKRRKIKVTRMKRREVSERR